MLLTKYKQAKWHMPRLLLLEGSGHGQIRSWHIDFDLVSYTDLKYIDDLFALAESELVFSPSSPLIFKSEI